MDPPPARPPSNLEDAFQRASAPKQDGSLLSRRGALTLKNQTVEGFAKNSKNAVLEELGSRRTVKSQITRIRKPFRELYVEEQEIHDGGEQCRIKRVRSTRTGKIYVVKVQLKAKIRGRNEALFRRMTERMMNLPDSPNVIKVFACYEDDKYFYTLLESLQGGDLFDFFRVLTSDSLEPDVVEKEVKKIISSLLESLQHLHSQGLIHKDVKLENIVFKEKGATTPKSGRT